MEIIPPRIFTYGDGVPAYKSGEWYGSKPNHFIGSKLILRPIKPPEKEFSIGHSKHFPPKYSEEFIFKPGKKFVPPVIHEDIYKPKKRQLKPLIIEPIQRFRDTSHRPKDQFNSTQIAPFLQHKIRIKQNFSNLTEYGIESVMNRKKRIYSLPQQRNQLKNCKPGDKNYNCVENSPDFYKMEGLIPGSTNTINYRKTTRKGEDNFYQTLDLNIKVLDRNKIWTSKELNDALNNDKNYVEQLNNWEAKVLESGKDNTKDTKDAKAKPKNNN